MRNVTGVCTLTCVGVIGEMQQAHLQLCGVFLLCSNISAEKSVPSVSVCARLQGSVSTGGP